jgi:hypothetical protein
MMPEATRTGTFGACRERMYRVRTEERVHAAGVAPGAVFPQAFDEERDGIARTDDRLGLRDGPMRAFHQSP